MIIYGTVVSNPETRNDGSTWVRVRVPSIHGASDIRDYRGSKERHNRVPDNKLPLYPCVVFSSPLLVGETVVMESMRNNNENWLITNRTGSRLGSANIEGVSSMENNSNRRDVWQ